MIVPRLRTKMLNGISVEGEFVNENDIMRIVHKLLKKSSCMVISHPGEKIFIEKIIDHGDTQECRAPWLPAWARS